MKIIHKTSLPLLVVLATFFIPSLGANASTTTTTTKTDLGILGGSNFSQAFDISDDGLIAVGRSATGTPSSYTSERAFKYESGVMTDIGTLGSGDRATAYAISGDGSTIVGYSNLTSGGSTFRAFKYDGTTMTNLGVISGGSYSYALGASGDGSIIVGDSSNGSHNRAFIYSGGVMSDLGLTLGGNSSSASGISYDGTVIVGDSTLSGDAVTHAFKYDGTTITDLGDLGGGSVDSYAYKVSNDNLVIVGQSELTSGGATNAFKYVGTTMTGLGTLGGTNSYAYDLSSDGSVIVGESDVTGDTATHAFKYTGTSMTDLGTLGGDNSVASGVSSDGTTISGYSQDSSGVYHAFLYKITTSTSSLVDVDNTYTSLYYNGSQLHSLMNLKNTLLKNSLTQDCNKFGANNMCISLGYRYANTNHYNAQENATNLKLAYRVTPNFRIGTVLDQAFSSNDPQNFTVKNSQPLFGIFANFSQNPDESGLNLKVSAAYHNSKMSVKRSTLANTEAGVGSTNLKSTGLLAELSYAAKISDKLQVRPFVGMRQTEISRDAYSETSGADFPITYEAVKQKFTTAIFGVRSNFELTKAVGLNFGVSVEQNLRSRVDGYSGSISQMGSFSLASPNVRKTTAFVDAGVNYEINEAQRLSSNVIYGTQALNTAKVAMVYLNYAVGF